jgi:chromosome segregation ATPase
MTGDQLINELKENVKKAGEKIQKLTEEKRGLQAALAEKEALLKEKKQVLKDLQTKYETLKLAKSLTGVMPEGEDARGRINLIIRDLDRCIGLLNR